MKRIITLFCLLFTFFGLNAQEVSPTDKIIDKVVLYLPNHTKSQLDNLATNFATIPQITKAVFVKEKHNCLLIDVQPDNAIQFYSDIIKLVSMQFPLNEIKLKTPAAYTEIFGKGDNGNTIKFTTIK